MEKSGQHHIPAISKLRASDIRSIDVWVGSRGGLELFLDDWHDIGIKIL